VSGSVALSWHPLAPSSRLVEIYDVYTNGSFYKLNLTLISDWNVFLLVSLISDVDC
jgi:hypothetical protein